MKILHIISHLKGGGAEKLMVDLLPRFRDSGIEVELLTFNGEITPHRQTLENEGIKIYDFGINNSPYNPINIFRLYHFMRKYDIIHTHTTAPQIFTAINSVLCSAIICTTEHTTTNRRRGLWWYAPIDKWMYGRYKKIISISDKTESSLKTYLDQSYKNNIITIHNGIDVNRYLKATPAKDFVKYMDIVKIVMVGGFRKAKNQDCIIRAIARLSARFHVFFIGDGEREKELRNLAEKLDVTERVHFLGFRNDIPEILHSCDIYVQSSHWEGFGLAAVEGLASGLPLVASNVDGLAQVVGDSGYLFPPNDDKKLSEIIVEIVTNSDLRKPLKKSIDRAFDFDITQMVEKYIKVYKEII